KLRTRICGRRESTRAKNRGPIERRAAGCASTRSSKRALAAGVGPTGWCFGKLGPPSYLCCEDPPKNLDGWRGLRGPLHTHPPSECKEIPHKGGVFRKTSKYDCQRLRRSDCRGACWPLAAGCQ